jgi:hypothetical protein
MKNLLNKYFTVRIFGKDENLKYRCTTKFKEETATELFNNLSNLKRVASDDGDVNFNHLLFSAINYFFTSIYGRTNKDDLFIGHKVKDEFYTIAYIKQCFDNCNRTDFVPVDRIVAPYVELSNPVFYSECYLIIQTAYFFATRFGQHQFLEYTEHYARTGEKLPPELYEFDFEVLSKKYDDIAKSLEVKENEKQLHPIKNYLFLWYSSAIELILNESKIKNDNFRQTEKDGHFRVYNAFAQCPRTLRYSQAFQLVQCDISSAYPTMIDLKVGSSLGKSIYDQLAAKRNISRSQAKILFNTALNSAKYRQGLKRDQYFSMLLDCGYTRVQALTILYEITDGKEKFFDWASKQEKQIIEEFKKQNRLFNGTRVHDAIVFLHLKKLDYSSLKLNVKGFTFSLEHLNIATANDTFYNSNRFILNKKISFAPSFLGLVNSWTSEIDKRNTKGTFSGFVDVKTRSLDKDVPPTEKALFIDVSVYSTFYQYATCNIETEKYNSESGLVHSILNYNSLLERFAFSFKLCQYWTDRNITKSDIYTIVERYRTYSNLCFDVDTVVKELSAIDFYDFDSSTIQLITKQRDWSFNSSGSYDDDFEFNQALTKAKKTINQRYYISLVMDWFAENPFTFLKPSDIGIKRVRGELKEFIDGLNFIYTGTKTYSFLTFPNNFDTPYMTYNIRVGRIKAKSEEDKKNKGRYALQMSKLQDKIKKLDDDKEKFIKEREAILDFVGREKIFNPKNKNHKIKKYLEANNINYQTLLKFAKIYQQHKNYIIEWEDDRNFKTYFEKDAPQLPKYDYITAEFDTDLSNSVFYNRVPELTEFKYKLSLQGYALDFYKFHSKNWDDVERQIRDGQRTINPYVK